MCMCVCACLSIHVYICVRVYAYVYIYSAGYTDYFDIVVGVLQGDTLAPYLFIICLDYVLTTFIDKMKDNGFKLTKERSRRYPAQTITDADYDDDIAFLTNTPARAEVTKSETSSC